MLDSRNKHISENSLKTVSVLQLIGPVKMLGSLASGPGRFVTQNNGPIMSTILCEVVDRLYRKVFFLRRNHPIRRAIVDLKLWNLRHANKQKSESERLSPHVLDQQERLFLLGDALSPDHLPYVDVETYTEYLQNVICPLHLGALYCSRQGFYSLGSLYSFLISPFCRGNVSSRKVPKGCYTFLERAVSIEYEN